jgi:two-component system sensor histidine kinase UhpB
MSIRIQINLLITALVALFAAALLWQHVDDTRRSVAEEIEAASLVATQLLTRVGAVYSEEGMPGMTEFLNRVGRIRANDIRLLSDSGTLLYASPSSTYKAGRFAPAWYAGIVTPDTQPHSIGLVGGTLELRADASRAVLDGWDGFRQLMALVIGGMICANLAGVWIAGRLLSPVRQVVDGLKRIESGDFSARVKALPGSEGRLIEHAFNRMAQAVEDGIEAKVAVAEANRQLAENRALTNIIQSRIEQERRTIARELHDELGQQLTAITSMSLSVAQRMAGKDAVTEQTARLIASTSGALYDAVHDLIPLLRPAALDNFGLSDALTDFIDDLRLQYPDIRFEYRVAELPEGLPEAVNTTVYRIAQEAINNAIKHAHPRVVELRTDFDGGAIELNVSDDGPGMDEATADVNRFGLTGMRERAASLDGRLELLKGAMGGLRVRAVIPASQAASPVAESPTSTVSA